MLHEPSTLPTWSLQNKCERMVEKTRDNGELSGDVNLTRYFATITELQFKENVCASVPVQLGPTQRNDGGQG